MSENVETFKTELYNKFFVELKKKENIDKETFYNSEFHLYDFFELDEKRDCTRCVCEVKITKIFVLKSYILDKEIIIGSECLKKMIGCTRLHAVSGILRTQRGRRGSGLGRLRAGTASAGPALCGRAGPTSSYQATLRRPSPLWLNSRPLHLSPPWLNSGRRRAPPTSHWPWVSSRAACRRAGSPARIATAVLAGVQWGGLGLAPPFADRRQHRVSWGPGDRWSRPSPVRGWLGGHSVADRQRRAAAPVPGSPD